jgi:2-desacetyl-2-hydroxyethyl bacteriochlorophyllide A dehydrogenase
MLAVVKEKPGRGWELRDVPKPRLSAGEVLIRVRAVGICGSDLAIYDGREKDLRLPVVPGHEFAGEVVESGPAAQGVQGIAAGARVAVNLVRNCGSCRECRKGNANLCLNPNLIGFHSNGGFAEFAGVPAGNCHLLPEGMSWEAAASIDPATSALAAVQKAGIAPAERVVILGPGPIGLYACQLARLQGAREVLMVGTRAHLLEKARELGAHRTFLVKRTDLAEVIPEILEASEGRGAEVVVEATGNPAALDLALQIAAKGGRIALVSIYHERTAIEPNTIVFKELKVLGSFDYRWIDFENALQLIAGGRLRTEPLITHRLPLARIQEGIELMQSRRAIKVMLTPSP